MQRLSMKFKVKPIFIKVNSPQRFKNTEPPFG